MRRGRGIERRRREVVTTSSPSTFARSSSSGRVPGSGRCSTGASRSPVIIEPKKAYDHLCDALRFIVVTMRMLGPLDELPPPVTVQEAWENQIKERLHGPLREAMAEAERWRGR